MRAAVLIIKLMVVASALLAMPLITIISINTLFDTGIPLNQWSYLSMMALMLIIEWMINRRGDKYE